LDKNIKKNEMKAIVRKRQKRKLIDTNKPELRFKVREKVVDSKKVDRWIKRNNLPENDPVAPSPAACKRPLRIVLHAIVNTY
jgi:hypothetical protein